jgi:hypothetical protein
MLEGFRALSQARSKPVKGLLLVAAAAMMLVSGASDGVLAAPAPYSFTWLGTPAAPQPWRPGSDWQLSVHDRDLTNTFDRPYPFPAQHGANCSPFQGFGVGGTHVVSTYADLVFICNNHLMTGINGQGYGEITFTPAQLVDWSTGTASITWRMSTLRTSCRDWLSFNLMPFMDNLQFTDGFGVDLYGEPKNEIQINDGASCPSAFAGTDIRNFAGAGIAGPGGSVESVVPQSSTVRSRFELDVSSTHVRFGMPDSNVWFVDGNLASPLPYTQAVFQFEQHSYTPDKECTPTPIFCQANTWHWSDVTISKAVPFTILNADAFQVGAPGGLYPSTVHFPAPAPANSFLRFEELSAGTMTVTTNAGQVLPVTRQQAADGNTSGALTDGQMDLIFMSIPAGTTSVTFAAQDAYWSSWTARNIAIWSQNTGPAPQPSPSASPSPSPSASPSAIPSPSPSPSPLASPSPSPRPSPSPSPSPSPAPISINGMPCTVTMNGVPMVGTCSGTFQPH